MMSRIPPVSPASIMLVLRSSKMTGYWRMALASVEPPSTVVRTPVSVFWKVGFSWLAARISRHCTSGRPASIMTENCRKKMAMSLVLTLPDPKVGRANSLPFSRIAPGVMRSLRSCAASVCLFAAVRSPLIFCPVALFPENVKTGMCASPRYLLTALQLDSKVEFLVLPLALRCRRCVLPQAGAAVDHFLQLVRRTGPGQGHLQRDLLCQIRRRQRLIEGLHAELVLARLHRRIDLVDLVFADQVADGGIRHQNLHHHGASLAINLGQQRLT